MEEDLPAGVAEDPERGAKGFDRWMGAEGAISDEGEGGGELLKLEVGEGGSGTIQGFSGESGEDFRTRVDAAGRTELSEVVGEEGLESFGVLACGGGEELLLEGFEGGGEERDGGDGDAISVSLRETQV